MSPWALAPAPAHAVPSRTKSGCVQRAQRAQTRLRTRVPTALLAAQKLSRGAHQSLKGSIRRAPLQPGGARRTHSRPRARLGFSFPAPRGPWQRWPPLRAHEPSQREDVPLRGPMSSRMGASCRQCSGQKLGHNVTSPVCDNVQTIPSERGDSGPHRGGLL